MSDALRGKRILLTGATGFIAKVVLEKLIRDVPGLGGIVLLLRGNAGQRLHRELLASSVFDVLRQRDAQRLHEAVQQRLRCVSGDIAEPDLGLDPEAFAALASEIDVVVHVAASVDFREPLDRALAVNALSLQALARLARLAGGIALVQVSTCYVNGLHRGAVAETLAPPARADLPRHAGGHFEVDGWIAELQSAIAGLKARIVEPAERSRALVALGIREARRRGWNDTYTFTKWLGEQIAWRECAGGTLTIVRPAIVESTWREPLPGWIEGMKVGDAIVLAYARGKTTLFPARTAGVADIVPADLVANTIVLAAAQALARPGRRRIVQVASSVRNPVRVGEYIRLCQDEMRGNAEAYPRLIKRPLGAFRTVPRPLFMAWLATAHAAARLVNAVVPLALFDRLETTRELAEVFSFYTSPRCVFECTRLLEMADEFEPADRERFPGDPACIDWPAYVARVHLPGLERFALKDRAAQREEPGFHPGYEATS
ncbi:MAG TPA: fatty acyl-CoA reductase [Albitalea sp.]|uniref:fatty acyl-CoA reductase n=1 Tax=Piscinibacter sp. TaxID=1903157 RepID=UPI002ED40188